MGKSVFVLIFVLLLSSPAATLSSDPIPQEHWVYRAVETLAEGSFLPVAPNPGSLNRFEVALLVASVIQYIDTVNISSVQRFGVSREVVLSEIIADYNSRASASQTLSSRQIMMVDQLAYEFRFELKALGYAIKDPQLHNNVAQRIEQVLLAERAALSPDLFATVEQPGATTSKSLWIPEYPINPATLWEEIRQNTITVQTSMVHESMEEDRLLDWELQGLSPIVDGKIPARDDLVLRAGFMRSEFDGGNRNSIIAALTGKYLLTNDVTLEGQYLHNTDHPLSPGLMQLGATVRIGDVELGGSLRSLQADQLASSSNPTAASGAGYELSVRFGDLSVSTGRDQFAYTDQEHSRLTTTTVDLSYSLPNSLLVSAGYRQVDSNEKTVIELGNPAVTSLGLDIPFPQGRLLLGVTSEWMDSPQRVVQETGKGNDGIEVIGSADAEKHSKKTASVGFSYLINSEASFQLNYKLIDFSSMNSTMTEQKTNQATAEFSIRF